MLDGPPHPTVGNLGHVHDQITLKEAPQLGRPCHSCGPGYLDDLPSLCDLGIRERVIGRFGVLSIWVRTRVGIKVRDRTRIACASLGLGVSRLDRARPPLLR